MSRVGAERDEAGRTTGYGRGGARTGCVAIEAGGHVEDRAKPQEDAIRLDHGGEEPPGRRADPPIQSGCMKSTRGDSRGGPLHRGLLHRRGFGREGSAYYEAAARWTLPPATSSRRPPCSSAAA